MSYFDPYDLYTSTKKRATRSGQINQKKPVDPHFALTGADLTKALNIMKAFNYYFSKSPPKYLSIPFTYSIYNSELINSLGVAFDVMFSQLHDHIRSMMLSQYNSIFTDQYNMVQMVLLLNSFQGYFTDSVSQATTVTWYVTNRFANTQNYTISQNQLCKSFFAVNDNLLDYGVITFNTSSSQYVSFNIETGSNNTSVPGALEGYPFPTADSQFNYFKEIAPDTNPFPTDIKLGINANHVNIKADRIVTLFTLNIFISYFFYIFFFLF